MNLDDPEVLIFEQQLEAKVRKNIFHSKGKEVNLDYFLYSCFEQEQTRKALDTGKRLGQWSEVYEHEISEGKLDDLVGDLFSWYGVQCPEMASAAVLDHGLAAELVPAFVRLIHDLTQLFKTKSGAAVAPERTADGGPHSAFWAEVDREISKRFPRHAGLMLAYLDWRFGPETKEQLDLGSIPPVGRHAKTLLRGRISRKGSSPRDKKPSSSDRPPQRAQGGGNHTGGNQGRANHSGGNQGGGNQGRGNHQGQRDRQKGGRPERGDDNKRFGKPKSEMQKRPDRKISQPDPEREKMVMAEAESAVDKMRSDPGVTEILLKPQNSFLRRIQHQLIVDAGFRSESTGENAERAVKILR